MHWLEPDGPVPTLAQVRSLIWAAARHDAGAARELAAEVYGLGDAGWPLAEAEGVEIERVFRILDETTRRPVEQPVRKVIERGLTVGLGNHTLLVARDGTELPIDDSAAAASFQSLTRETGSSRRPTSTSWVVTR